MRVLLLFRYLLIVVLLVVFVMVLGFCVGWLVDLRFDVCLGFNVVCFGMLWFVLGVVVGLDVVLVCLGFDFKSFCCCVVVFVLFCLFFDC